MITGGPNQASRPHQGGFTLVELLMVMLIVSLLAAILMPTIISSMKLIYATRCRAKIATLEEGIIGYARDHNYYPGQDPTYVGQLAGDGGSFTGSRWLAKAMYSDPDGSGFKKSGYAPYKPDDSVYDEGSHTDTIADCFPADQVMPLCYYPSRIDVTDGDLDQYEEGDNSAYTTGHAGSVSFNTFITSQFGGAVKDKEYLLVAPGVDRLFFTGDDIKNF